MKPPFLGSVSLNDRGQNAWPTNCKHLVYSYQIQEINMSSHI